MPAPPDRRQLLPARGQLVQPAAQIERRDLVVRPVHDQDRRGHPPHERRRVEAVGPEARQGEEGDVPPLTQEVRHGGERRLEDEPGHVGRAIPITGCAGASLPIRRAARRQVDRHRGADRSPPHHDPAGIDSGP